MAACSCCWPSRSCGGSRTRSRNSTDPLTGLANRRRISEDGTRLLAQRTGGDQVAVLTIDLDGFKALNDAHGHEAGDRALVLVGDCLRDLAQPGSMVGRLGGDEFVVALPVQTVGAGVTRAKRILITVRQLLDAEFPDTELGVSGGIAVSSDAGDDFATLIREADRALISAKTDYRGMLQLADRLVSSAVVTD